VAQRVHLQLALQGAVPEPPGLDRAQDARRNDQEGVSATIVSAPCKLGSVDEATEVLAAAPPVAASYNAVVLALCREFTMQVWSG
jgi:hypothetical protein